MDVGVGMFLNKCLLNFHKKLCKQDIHVNACTVKANAF
jgi:hypothetical protein